MQYVLTRTPLRMSFFGGGSDYPNWCEEYGGSVLSTTIDKYIYLSCRYLPPFFNVRHRIVWRHVELVDSISEILHPAIREGLKYLEFDDAKGIEIHYQADLPARTGMGSSSSFIAGMINGLLALRMEFLSKEEIAKMSIDLELNWMKETVGLQDQVAASYGGFNQIKFGPDLSFEVNPIQITDEREQEFLSNLMLFYIGSNRLGNEITKEIVTNIKTKKSTIFRMVELVDEAMEVIVNGEFSDFGEMLDETWNLKRSISDGISTSIIDEIYQAATHAGAIGGKLLGAGGTGFMIFMVPHDKQESVRSVLTPKCLEVPFKMDKTGSSIMHHSNKQGINNYS